MSQEHNCISYSIFGYGKDMPDSFSFNSYLRLFSLNVKMAELIYPDWRIHICIERNSYEAYRELFDYLDIDIEVLAEDKFCTMMLWRWRPVFTGKYDRVLSRDVDSLIHYRERQAVENWIPNGRCVHTIADSQSHNIPLMGGMVGCECIKFINLINCTSWEQMIGMAKGIDFNQKGTDQQFFQRFILPLVHENMVEHYVEGMPQSFRGACYNFIQEDTIQGIDPALRESTYLVSHIGQAGFAIEPVLLFIDKFMKRDRKDWYKIIEEMFPQVHYWINDKD